MEALIPESFLTWMQSIEQKLQKLSSSSEQSDFIAYEKAMEILDCSRQTLDRMRADGSLKVYRLKGKGRMYVKQSELMQLLEADNVAA